MVTRTGLFTGVISGVTPQLGPCRTTAQKLFYKFCNSCLKNIQSCRLLYLLHSFIPTYLHDEVQVAEAGAMELARYSTGLQKADFFGL